MEYVFKTVYSNRPVKSWAPHLPPLFWVGCHVVMLHTEFLRQFLKAVSTQTGKAGTQKETHSAPSQDGHTLLGAGASLARERKQKQGFAHPPDSLPAPSQDSPEAACAACPGLASQSRPSPAWRPGAGWILSWTRSSFFSTGQ